MILLIVYAWKMYDMQTLHAGGIPMFRGTYLVFIVNIPSIDSMFYIPKVLSSLGKKYMKIRFFFFKYVGVRCS